jgi:hypothetical protein
MTTKPMTADDLRAITAASAGFRGTFVHLPATGNVVFSPRDNDELHTIAEDLEPHVAEPLVAMLDGVPRLLAEVERLTKERDMVRRLHVDACGEWDKVEQERGAALDLTDPASEPDAEVLAAPVRCDCCSVTIPAGDSAVMFTDEQGRECWAHYWRCPFEERTIALAFARGERREVAALVYGLWAMHRDADGLDWHNGRETLSWRVTHVPSGLAISNGWYTEREARRIVQRLGVSFSSDRFAVLATKTEEARLIGAAVEEALHG